MVVSGHGVIAEGEGELDGHGTLGEQKWRKLVVAARWYGQDMV